MNFFSQIPATPPDISFILQSRLEVENMLKLWNRKLTPITFHLVKLSLERYLNTVKNFRIVLLSKTNHPLSISSQVPTLLKLIIQVTDNLLEQVIRSLTVIGNPSQFKQTASSYPISGLMSTTF